MERISIFNYEAFYLDFLEGNLSEEDTCVLMKFLEENPSLKMEDDDLPLFEAEQISLSSETKIDLKQPLLTDAICLNNVEFFLICEAEGLLSDSKLAELSVFVQANQSLIYDRGIYAIVNFKPDLSVVYSDKAGLKRRKTIVFWPYISVASAAAIIVFFMAWQSINNPTIDVVNNKLIKANNRSEPEQNKSNSAEKNLEKENNNLGELHELNITEYVANNSELSSNVVQSKKKVKDSNVDRIHIRTATPVLTAMHNGELEPITKKTFTSTQVSNQAMDKNKALAKYADMNNPIEPVTSFIESKTKTEVDFRTTKKVEGKPRGFFIKIGKFEVSRNRH